MNYICTFSLTEGKSPSMMHELIQASVNSGTVHLFIGTGRSPVKITFMSLITSYNHDTSYHGLIGLFLFKLVQPFVSRRTIMPKLLG